MSLRDQDQRREIFMETLRSGRIQRENEEKKDKILSNEIQEIKSLLREIISELRELK